MHHGDDDGAGAGPAAEHVEHEELVTRIERRHRLVDEEHRGLGRERPGKERTGPLAARELGHRAGLEAAQARRRRSAAATASAPSGDSRSGASPCGRRPSATTSRTAKGQDMPPICGR